MHIRINLCSSQKILGVSPAISRMAYLLITDKLICECITGGYSICRESPSGLNIE